RKLPFAVSLDRDVVAENRANVVQTSLLVSHGDELPVAVTRRKLAAERLSGRVVVTTRREHHEPASTSQRQEGENQCDALHRNPPSSTGRSIVRIGTLRFRRRRRVATRDLDLRRSLKLSVEGRHATSPDVRSTRTLPSSQNGVPVGPESGALVA